MGVIYVKDFEPWAALGELAGQYFSHRLGALQNNKMAKGYQAMLGGGAGGEQDPNTPQIMDNNNRMAGMGMQQPNSAGQINQLLSNSNNTFANNLMQKNNIGLWGGQNPAAPAQPMQANTDTPAAPVQQQNTGLWNFQNLNNTGINTGLPQTYQEMMQQRANNPFRGAPKLVESGNTNEDKAPGQYSIPDKATVTSEARKRLGANTLALVKAGFDFKTAQSLASDQYQNDVNTMYAQQVNEYQEKVLEPMRQQILNNLVFTQDKDGNPVVDTYNTKRVKGLAPAVARYNYLASKVGAGTIDMNNLNSIAALDKPDYKFSSAQNGHIVRYNMGDGTIQDMGGYGKVETKQFANGQVIVMTPDGQMKNIGNFGAKNVKVMPDGKTYIVGTDGSMQYVGMHVKPATATQTGTSGYNAQVLRTLSAQHTAWVKANPDKDESESPYYGKLQGALNGTPTAGGGGTPTVKRQPTYSAEEQAAVSKRMNELSAQGWSDDQIAAELDAAGYGNYKSWLKSY
ncbi:MAG: hypothetical protein E6488_01560 [Veillonella parvula]|uniref:hypothetical protein n=1 Tax=Veillonella parvula TaxID=29466 RepID=UPI00290A4EDA|nr:hypothetical protein [Veillonella parvula]MDU6636494.1 hypothetical protein [Veillonella parvula]